LASSASMRFSLVSTIVNYSMKRLSLYLIPLLAISLTSCETGKKFDSHGFEGNYEMRTTVYWENENGAFEEPFRDVISPVQVYVEKGHLYIRTNNFGMPNMGDYDKVEVEFSYDPPVEPSEPLTEGGDGEGIENVTVETKAAIIMQDGFVFVISGDKRLKSLPIEALDVKENQILFRNSEDFDVPLTSADGMTIAVMRNHFEYAPATLLNDTIKWDIEFFGDAGTNSSVSSSGTPEKVHVKYHNTLVRK